MQEVLAEAKTSNHFRLYYLENSLRLEYDSLLPLSDTMIQKL